MEGRSMADLSDVVKRASYASAIEIESMAEKVNREI